MVHKSIKMILAVVLVLAGVSAGVVQAQSGTTAPAPAATTAAAQPTAGQQAAPSLMDAFHNPAPWLEMGADFRFREHYGYNWTALSTDKTDTKGNEDHKFHFERWRTRWWTKSKLDENTAINTRFTWEFRTWQEPASKPQDTDLDEIIMDNLNFAQKNFLGLPVNAIIGRQDMVLGQGWLVADGTPLDGSRTFYFDAARFTVDLAEKTKMDLIYIRNMPNSDWWLKPINDRHKYVTQEQEEGAILYLTDKSTTTQLEGYFMYKNNNPVDPTFHKAFVWPQNVVNIYSKKAEIYTFGGAASAPFCDNWTYRAEAAVQTGRSASPSTTVTANDHEESLLALGGKGTVEYSFKDTLDNKLHLIYEYLSGDNPDTERVTSFNPLWGQWPQWSELYQPYVTQLEDNLVSNLQRLAFGHKIKPNTQWEILTDYNLLWANANTFRDDPRGRFSDSSKFRGHLLTCWARYNFTKQLKGNLVFEYLWPGHYYGPNNRDNALYFHWTVEYTF